MKLLNIRHFYTGIFIVFLLTLTRCADISLDGKSSPANLAVVLLAGNGPGAGLNLSGALTESDGNPATEASLTIISSSDNTRAATDPSGNWEAELSSALLPQELRVSINRSGSSLGTFRLSVTSKPGGVSVNVIREDGNLGLKCQGIIRPYNAGVLGLVINGRNIVLTEGGAYETYRVSLNRKPSSSFAVEFSARYWVLNGAGVNVLTAMPVVFEPGQIVFTPENFDVPQELRIRAVADDNGLDESGYFSARLPSQAVWTTFPYNIKIKDIEAKHVFLTSAAFASDMGGVSGADAKCAGDANYPGQGIYKAMIVTSQAVVQRRIACHSADCKGGESEHEDWVFHASTTYRRASDNVSTFDTDVRSLIDETTLRAFVDSGIVYEAAGFRFWTGFIGIHYNYSNKPSNGNFDWRAAEEINSTAPSTCNGWSGNSWYWGGTGGLASNLSGLFLAGGGGGCTGTPYPGTSKLLCIEQ